MTPHQSAGTRFSRPAGVAGVEALRIRTGRDAPRFYHEAYCMVANVGGSNQWSYRRRLHSCADDGFGIMEPGEVHAVRRVYRPGEWRILFVEPTALAELAQEPTAPSADPHFSLASVAQAADADLFARLLGLHDAILDGSSSLEQQSRLTQVLRLLLERYAERPPGGGDPGPDRRSVRLAREYLHAHWAEGVSLDALAAAAGASKYHLLRTFRDELGLPPHAYLIQLRLARAKALLARGGSVAEVAAETGFAAQPHLHRHFLRTYGVTPARYARAVRA